MITEWLISLAVSVANWVAALFPTKAAPDWFTGFPDRVNAFFAQFNGVGVWVDWLYLGGVFAVVLGWWGSGFAIKGIRALIGHVPEFGGNG